MERWQLKVLCFALTLLICYFCCFLPFAIGKMKCGKVKTIFKRRKDKRKNFAGISNQSDETVQPTESKNKRTDKQILGYLMCFGGGVFLSTFLLHMLPEVVELLKGSLITPQNIEYPLAHLIIAIGFFLILFVESLVELCQSFKARRSKKQKSRTIDDRETHNVDGSLKFIKNISSIQLEENLSEIGIESSADSDNHHRIGEITSHHTEDHHHDDHQIDHDHHDHDHHHNQIDHDHHDHQHDHHHHNQNEQQHHHHHSTRSIALVLALSLHHIFEGLSVGLQKSFGDVWHLAIAVLCHETAISFSMGLQFYKEEQRLTKKTFAILFIASSIMPLGVVIGIIISEVHQSGEEDFENWQNNLIGILQALACGTFLYVTFFEILCEELTHGQSSILKIIFVVLGFTLMALLGLIPESSKKDEEIGNEFLNSTELIDIMTTL